MVAWCPLGGIERLDFVTIALLVDCGNAPLPHPFLHEQWTLNRLSELQGWLRKYQGLLRYCSWCDYILFFSSRIRSRASSPTTVIALVSCWLCCRVEIWLVIMKQVCWVEFEALEICSLWVVSLVCLPQSWRPTTAYSNWILFRILDYKRNLLESHLVFLLCKLKIWVLGLL